MKAKSNKMQSAAEFMLGNQINDIRAVRYGLYALYTFGSGDYELKDIPSTLKMLAQGPKALRAIKKALDDINELDDNLDLLTPKEIVSLGEVKLGSELSPVLSAGVITGGMYETVFMLAEHKVMSLEELVSFSNLAFHFIIEEAKCAIEYERTGRIEARESLVEMHMRQTEVTGAFVMHMFKRDQKITEHVKNGGTLDYEFLAGHYQSLFNMCRLTQYKDDMLDLYKDTLGESLTNRPMPNIVMLESQRAGELFSAGSELSADYQALSDIRMSEEARIPFDELPPAVHRAVTAIAGNYKDLAATFPKVMRDLLSADIENVLKDGVYITKDGEVEDNERKWHQKFTRSASLSSRFNKNNCLGLVRNLARRMVAKGITDSRETAPVERSPVASAKSLFM